MLSPITAMYARISKPLWLNIHSTGEEVAGGQKTYITLEMHNFLFCLNFAIHQWRIPSLHGPKSQDRDRDTRVQHQNQDRDQGLQKRVSRYIETQTQVSRTPSLFLTESDILQTSQVYLQRRWRNALEFSVIKQHNGYYAVQGHSKSAVLVRRESPHATSY